MNNKKSKNIFKYSYKITLSLFIITFAYLLNTSSLAGAQETNPDSLISIGKEVYNLKGCSGCHKIAGSGGDMGPDLTNEGNIVPHDAAWHKKHFKDPQSVVPNSTMPNLSLSDKEINALTAFMQSLRSVDLPKDIEGTIKLAHEKLDEARKGIDEIKKSGFNVDNLEVKYIDGWTHLETINNMIYTHNLTGVSKETEDAINLAKEIMEDVHSYKKELEHRIVQGLILIVLFVIIGVLVFIKVLTILNASEQASKAVNSK
ncbi:MAG: cbb3-type cytochrome c oxidase subunit II [Nitrospirae bacterium]|nr:cbb3-type cytochrome c oxidase subunit II [Nitrospirota bacterium]